MLEQFGRDPSALRPAPRLREAHRAMRSLLDTGAVDQDGEFFRYSGVFTTARATAPRVPLLIGAMGGPLTFRLAGEVADGVYCACSFSREALAYVVDNVRIGAERAGRDIAQLDLCASLTAAVSDDGDAARHAARLKAAFYLPSMPPALLERHGVPFRTVEPISAAFARGDVAAALRLNTGRPRRPALRRRHARRGRRANPDRDRPGRVQPRRARARRRGDPPRLGRSRDPRVADAGRAGPPHRGPRAARARSGSWVVIAPPAAPARSRCAGSGSCPRRSG